MAGVGDWGKRFGESAAAVVADGVAAAAAASFVSGRFAVAGVVFAAALLSRRHAVTSAFTSLRSGAERAALACVVGALVFPPLGRWALGGTVAVVVSTVLRRAISVANARSERAWRTGLATLLVGSEADVRRAAQLFAAYPEHGVRPVATATPDGIPTALPNGSVDDISLLIAEHAVKHVVIVSDLGDRIDPQVWRSRPYGVRVSVLPPMADVLTTGAEIVDVRGLPFISLAPRRRPSGSAWLVKRSFDFVVAGLALVLVLPVFAMTAVATLIDSGRPVLFKQKRVGRDGRLFDLWKFRSMVVDAEAQLIDLRQANEASGPYFKIERDPRVTRVGRLLRRMSIDELPQLINVLRGEMSLVGPRPCLPDEMALAPESFEWRLSITPGITGLWQVAGRSWLPFEEGVRMDLAYVEHWSLALDLRIMVRTVSAALRGDRRPSVVGAGTLPSLTRSRYLALVDGDDLVKSPDPCDLSIVIVTHESKGDIVACLDSLRVLPDRVSREVILVDNVSKDGTADLVETAYPEVRLIRKRRRDGFATNANIGAVSAAGRHVLFLNPDTTAFAGALDRLVDHLDLHPECGVVGPRLVYPDGTHQASARRFPTPLTTIVRRTPLRRVVGVTTGIERHLMEDTAMTDVMQVDWLLGAVIAVRSDALHDIGGFDDRFRLYCEDIDLCWRFHEAGYRVEYLTSATVQHALGELTSKRFFTVRTIWHFRSMLRFVRLHGLRPQPPVSIGARAFRSPTRIDLLDGPAVTENVA